MEAGRSARVGAKGSSVTDELTKQLIEEMRLLRVQIAQHTAALFNIHRRPGSVGYTVRDALVRRTDAAEMESAEALIGKIDRLFDDAERKGLEVVRDF